MCQIYFSQGKTSYFPWHISYTVQKQQATGEKKKGKAGTLLNA